MNKTGRKADAYLWVRSPKTDNEGNIVLRVPNPDPNAKSRYKFPSLGLPPCPVELWDKEQARVKTCSLKKYNYLEANILIEQAIKNHLEGSAMAPGETKPDYTGLPLSDRSRSFLTYFKHWLPGVANRGSRLVYQTILSRITKYVNEELKKSDLLFTDIDTDFARGFTAWCKQRFAPITARQTVQDVKQVLNSAIDEDIVEYKKHPFRQIRFTAADKAPLTPKPFLPKRDLQKWTHHFSEKILFQTTQYAAIFQFASFGRRISDLLILKLGAFSSATVTERSFHTVSQKSGKPATIPVTDNSLFALYQVYRDVEFINDRIGHVEDNLLNLRLANPYMDREQDEALTKTLLDSFWIAFLQYAKKNPEHFVFPYLHHLDFPRGQIQTKRLNDNQYRLMSNARKRYNYHLKRLYVDMGIDVHVTSHTFRHSHGAASLRTDKRWSIKDIGQSLDHSDPKTTEHYIRSFPQSVLKDLAQSVQEEINLLVEPD